MQYFSKTVAKSNEWRISQSSMAVWATESQSYNVDMESLAIAAQNILTYRRFKAVLPSRTVQHSEA
jgi:hypothetical protein